ncbi:MAG: hypothetical protein CSA65_00170 [Proteobacteria bacterium]|nr:MAG: hypothetical protein CSA65_00170 [Pseudomonadota bacterium]
MRFSRPAFDNSPLLTTLSVGALALALVTAGGCPGSTSNGPSSDGGNTCEASKQSGLYLLPFGPVTHSLLQGGGVSVSVIVIRGSQTQGEGHAEAGQTVEFRVIDALNGEVALDRASAVTDSEGMATVKATVTQTAEPAIYMVEASSAGTCAINFSLDVERTLRQLKAVTKSPFDTFTKSRIPITVEATTNGAAKLVDEEITFEITNGKTGETLLATIDNKTPGATLKLKTDGTGRATAMLATGSTAIPQLVVKATMAGTAAAAVTVRVQEGSTTCTFDSDCPLGYTCNTTTGQCEAPPTPPPTTGCTSNSDCQAPTICNTATGQCLETTGQGCDPIEGTGCGANEVCIGNQCAKLPTGCAANSECPPTWICDQGSCKPAGQPPTGGCKTPADCPANQTCVNGTCKPKAACNISGVQPNRLQGAWQFDSNLDLRDGLDGFTKAIFSVAGVLRDVIEGRFTIKGIPKLITKIVNKYLKQLIDQYVPPWGQQMAVALGNVNDIVDTMRVVSSVNINSVGNHNYVCSEKWDLIEFEYKGQKLSTPPSAIPEIGNVKVPNYTATEVCGVLFISKHKVKNVIGGLIKWAIETVLSVATCSGNGTPCYNNLEQALQGVIDCQMLALQIDQLVMSIWSSAPSVAGIIQPACDTAKQDLINDLNKALNDLTTKLTFFELSGTADIPNPGSDNQLKNGTWNGSLGYSLSKGNFKGTFKAVR